MDLGALVEGVVELDLETDRMVIRVLGEDGNYTNLDVQAALERYYGEEIRFIVTPMSSVRKLAEMVESGQMTEEAAADIKAPKTH